MGAPITTREELDSLLHQGRAITDLAARSQQCVDALAQGLQPQGENLRGGYLHEEEDWGFLFAPWSVTWPEYMYALAVAEQHSEFLDLHARICRAAELIQSQAGTAQHAVQGFFGRLFNSGKGEQGQAAAAEIDRELRAVEQERVAHRLGVILDAIHRAHELQRAGVELFPGPKGTPQHLITTARNALTRSLDTKVGQPRSYTFLPFDADRTASVMERAKRLQESPNAEPALRERAEILLDDIAEEKVSAFLAQLPTDALRHATAERLRFAGLDTAGIHTVADVHAAPIGQLTQISGIGQRTAERLKAAAETLRREAREAEPHAIGQEPSRPARQLVQLLGRFGAQDILEPDERARRRRLVSYLKILPEVAAGGAWFAVITGTEDDNRLWREFSDDLAWGQAHPELLEPPSYATDSSATWEDYLARPAHYQGLLATLLSNDDGEAGNTLDTRTLEAIRALRLDRTLLAEELHLRGYQSFGARFAVVRRKVVIGDEMGLGKTVQALAAASHVAATDGIERTRILVICPASVVVNWKREAKKFTHLPVFIAHGQVREDAVRAWESAGGICIVTFDGARTSDITAPEFVIVDEAHYIKNPKAQRSQAAKKLIDDAQHVILMTGTPLENRVEEFATLVDYVDPELLRAGMETMSAADFRSRIAPVYLRRNQADVLDELPGITEQLDWVELNDADQRWYRKSVAEGGWMAIRRAPLTTPDTVPAKVERISEIVGEAAEADRKVVVFSFFLDVLARLEDELGERVLATITGALAPGARQAAVDRLDNAPAGSVLLAQITAAGTGLNMQAASVVILTEPQLKPSTEAQAVARVNRMGQTRPVLAHRLIADDTVDERMLDMLGRKEQIFDAFARESESAAVPDAVDISEPKLAAEVIAAERKRLGIEGD